MRSRSSGNLRSNLALTLSALALVVASSGSAYAAVKIGTKDIKSNAVTSAKIKNNTITARDLKRGVAVSGPQGAQGVQGTPGSFPVELAELVPVAVFVFSTSGTIAAPVFTLTRDTRRAPMTGAPTLVRTGLGIYEISLPGIAWSPSSSVASCSTDQLNFVAMSSASPKMKIQVADKNGDFNADFKLLRCTVWGG